MALERLRTQDYHGSGRLHLHVLIFCTREALQNMNLDETLSATMPEKVDDADILPGIVEGSQLDRKGRSGWPVHEGCSGWDEEQDALMLAHSAEDHAKGLRPYFVDVMETLRCHQDLQVANDDGALRAYVTKYVSKVQRLQSARVVERQCRRQCHCCHGSLPVQALGARDDPSDVRGFHEAMVSSRRCPGASGTSSHPGLGRRQPVEVELYEKAEWAKGKISLLDFLRKTNKGRQGLGLDEEEAGGAGQVVPDA